LQTFTFTTIDNQLPAFAVQCHKPKFYSPGITIRRAGGGCLKDIFIDYLLLPGRFVWFRKQQLSNNPALTNHQRAAQQIANPAFIIFNHGSCHQKSGMLLAKNQVMIVIGMQGRCHDYGHPIHVIYSCWLLTDRDHRFESWLDGLTPVIDSSQGDITANY